MLPTDQVRYNELLSQGYTTEPRPQVDVQVESDGGGGDPGVDPTTPGGGLGKLNDEDLESLSNDPLKFGADALGAGLPFGVSGSQIGAAGAFLGGMPGMVAGGVAAAALELTNVAKARAALEVAKSQGLTGTEDYTALENSIKSAENKLSPVGRLLDNLGFGSGKAFEEQVGTVTPPTTAPTAPTAPTGGDTGGEGGGGEAPVPPARTPAPEREAVIFASEGPARGTVQGPGQAARPGSRPAPERVSAEEVAARVSADSRAAAQKAAEETPGISGTFGGGRATGGLVARPSHKKPVAKKK
jgi:hypothetical protein